MCGIVGYIGKKNAVPVLMDGLFRLEYRGYDSAGIAALVNTVGRPKIESLRKKGRVKDLADALKNKNWATVCGIAHTRWATHGKPSLENAHPHSDCDNNVFLVHNGIIENHAVLRDALLREGHEFTSETDTEVLAHLIERSLLHQRSRKHSLKDAVLDTVRLVEGSFAIAVISTYDPEVLVAARRGSPLLVGIGREEYILASDAAALVKHTKNVIWLKDDELAVMNGERHHIFTIHGKKIDKKHDTIDWNIEEAEKAGFPHFMLKEIMEAPLVIENALRGRVLGKEGLVKLGGLEKIAPRLASIKNIIIAACGTSYYAGLVGRYLMEEFAFIPTEVLYGSEMRYQNLGSRPDTLAIVISQSGETADTLGALRKARESNMLTLGIVNVVGSTVSREVDAGIYNYAGPEIAVASTKAFISQLTVLALLALYLGEKKLSLAMRRRALAQLQKLPSKAAKILAQSKDIERLAKSYAKYNHFLYLGRKYDWPVACEGALKLKEISYIHAEGYPAGEMKHGPIALVDENFPSIVSATSGSVYEKILSNIEELKARNGKVIALALEGNNDIKKHVNDVFYVPRTLEAFSPILSVIPLQLFAYYIAVLRGCDVDKPRNLAKSVTVE